MAEEHNDGQIRGRLLAPDDITDWGNGVRMVEPTIKTEAGTEVNKEETNDVTPPDDNSAASDTEVTSVADTVPEPVELVEDPGDYSPKDYSFDVVVYDEDGKNGRTVNVKSVDQFDELLEKDVNFGSAAALSKALRLSGKMETNLEHDKTAFDDKKAEYDSAVKNQEQQVQATNNMSNEMNYLVESGDLPEIDAKYKDADWSDPAIAKQDGIKEQIALLTFMRDENNRRKRLNLPAMTSVLDAFNAFERASSKTKDVDAKKLAGQQRKEAASVVAPASPSTASNTPKGIKVGRAGNLRDIGSLSSW